MRRALLGDLLDERDDGLLGRGVVPGRQRVLHAGCALRTRQDNTSGEHQVRGSVQRRSHTVTLVQEMDRPAQMALQSRLRCCRFVTLREFLEGLQPHGGRCPGHEHVRDPTMPGPAEPCHWTLVGIRDTPATTRLYQGLAWIEDQLDLFPVHSAFSRVAPSGHRYGGPSNYPVRLPGPEGAQAYVSGASVVSAMSPGLRRPQEAGLSNKR